jgi:hypothetical protein
MKKNRVWLIVGLVTTTVVSVPFVTYPLSYQPQSLALEAFEGVHDTWDYLHFAPGLPSKANVIYYPGGLVNPISYAYMGYTLASLGYDVFITKPLFHLQIVNPEQGKFIMQDYPSDLPWFIGGHSLGGTAAAFWVHEEPTLFEGLFFLGSYPSDAHDFADVPMKVLSLTASLDSVMNAETYEESLALLNPSTTTFVTVEGGNHSQFGDYGFQRGDTLATISTEAQHAFVALTLSLWMESSMLTRMLMENPPVE